MNRENAKEKRIDARPPLPRLFVTLKLPKKLVMMQRYQPGAAYPCPECIISKCFDILGP